MVVPAPAALAAVAAAVASGTAMLVGAPHGTPAGPHLAARVAAAPMQAPPPPGGAGRASRPLTVDPSALVPGSVGASPSMATPSAGASPFASGAVWATVNCAEVRIRFSGGTPTDAGGDLVPPGATSVTRCETPLSTVGAPLRALAAPKVLTSGVDRFTAVLNALPPVPADQACLPITLPVQVSLVFTLPEQLPLAVVVDPTCSALTAGDRARSYATLNPLPVFDALFGAQPSPS